MTIMLTEAGSLCTSESYDLSHSNVTSGISDARHRSQPGVSAQNF